MHQNPLLWSTETSSLTPKERNELQMRSGRQVQHKTRVFRREHGEVCLMLKHQSGIFALISLLPPTCTAMQAACRTVVSKIPLALISLQPQPCVRASNTALFKCSSRVHWEQQGFPFLSASGIAIKDSFNTEYVKLCMLIHIHTFSHCIYNM